MDITVEACRLTEAATPGATGMDRRGFVEVVSPRGEMASYHAVDEHSTLIDVPDLEPGERAGRDRRGGAWVRSRSDES